MKELNSQQWRVIGIVVAVLTSVSVLRGLATGSIGFLLVVPAILLGAFLFFRYGRSTQSVSMVAWKEREVPRPLLWGIAAALLLGILTMLLLPAPTAPPTIAEIPEIPLAQDQLTQLDGEGNLIGSQMRLSIYNGSDFYLRSILVRLEVDRKNAPAIDRKYSVSPSMPLIAVPPLSVGHYQFDVGFFYRPMYDSVSWSIVGGVGSDRY